MGRDAGCVSKCYRKCESQDKIFQQLNLFCNDSYYKAFSLLVRNGRNSFPLHWLFRNFFELEKSEHNNRMIRTNGDASGKV